MSERIGETRVPLSMILAKVFWGLLVLVPGSGCAPAYRPVGDIQKVCEAEPENENAQVRKEVYVGDYVVIEADDPADSATLRVYAAGQFNVDHMPESGSILGSFSKAYIQLPGFPESKVYLIKAAPVDPSTSLITVAYNCAHPSRQPVTGEDSTS